MAEYEVRSTAVNGFEMIYTRFGRGSKSFVMIPGMSLHPVSEKELICDFFRD